MARIAKGAQLVIVGLAIPILIGVVLPASLSPLFAFFCFFWTVLAARSFGIHAAVLAALSSSVLMWQIVFSVAGYPQSVRILGAVLFLGTSLFAANLASQTAKAAREAKEHYRSLVELAPDGIVVTDEDGRIVFANSALARIVGAPDREALLGRNEIDFVHPDDRELARQRLAQLAAGHPTSWILKKWLTLDGSVRWVESADVPMYKGNQRLTQGFIRDVTERLQAEEALEANRRRLQALFDNVLDAIVFFDADGLILEANPAATTLLGYSRDELVQKNIHEFIDARQTAGESPLAARDGTTRTVEHRCAMDVLPGLNVVVMRDVTARKEAEGAIRQLSGRLLRLQDDERRRIARQLHDTTAQNLAAVRLNLARIRRSEAAADPEFAESLEESMALTDKSIAEIRTLSYLLHPPLIEEAGLATTLKWYARGFEDRTGITVNLDIPDDLGSLTPDVETAVFRIIQEALTNIQRHSGSKVAQIRIDSSTERLRLEVRDEGKGLPPHFRKSTDALFASGLGMAGIRDRARELGGDVTIRSTDTGTTVAVALPVPQSELV